ncbi:CAMK family protein kinase [Histomonas meleagridis]|uniref:CAMK family protein kinase n=1 Tax=Histomonas meleagridis TaxID=135588 RepID=UPI00355AB6C9|nr:CAMK family protein kinase [Histomonas meleagridis]KAH0805482.1 CAMK family protein kinase [Histomonas meleagridis]
MQKYEQIRSLGQGGYGKAILAKNKENKQMFVIKEVRLTALSPKDREDALKEAKVLSSLKHPYIVEYTESFQERGCLYIVMGYADGGDLAKKIEAARKPFAEDEILHDFIQLALAIKYIHDRKILHRDLKGQNVFLMKDGTIKLGDFGIARVLEHTFQVCRTQIGTPYYLSPEICQGKPYDTKTDIWSLGCILYELCTLKHAFEAGNMNQLLMNIVRGRYTPISSNYSQGLRSLVDRMLTKEPEERPTINQILSIPFIKEKLSNFLDQTLMNYEMQHTVLHGRKPFAAPTCIVHKKPTPENNNNDENKNKDQKMEILQQKQMELERQYKAKNDELARREEAIRQKEEALERKRRQEQQLQEARKKREIEEQRKKAEEEKIEAERRKRQMEYEERNRIAQQNKNRNNNYNIFGGYDNNPQPQPQPRKNVRKDEISDEERKRLFMEQRREAIANRNRQRYQEMQGNDARNAICGGYKNDTFKEDRNQMVNMKKKKEEIDNNERMRIFMEQQRAARANKERMRQMEMGGCDAKDALNMGGGWDDTIPKKKENKMSEEEMKEFYRRQRQEAQANKMRLMQAEYGNNSPIYDEKPEVVEKKLPQKKEMNIDELNAYMREQRHIARANKARAEAAEYGNAFEEHSPRQNDKDDNNYKKPEKKEMNIDELNAYMREQRHIARANKARAEAAEYGNAFEEHSPRQNDKDENNYKKPEKKEMNIDELNAYMREQRHIARANKARAEAAEYGNAFEEQQSKQNSKEENIVKKPEKKEMNLEEINAYMREQRHIARANKAKAEAAEYGNGLNNEQLPKQNEKEENIAKKPEKKEMNLEEINAYMREQRHIARANKARAEAAEYGNAAEEQQQKQNDKEENIVKKPEKKEMNLEEINAYMREQRHIARANKARAEAAEYGNAAEEQQQKQNDKEENIVKKPEKKEMNLEEINAYMREQRHIARANRARAEAAERGNVTPIESQTPKQSNSNESNVKKPEKKEMNLEEINAYMREQRHIARANKARAEAAEYGNAAEEQQQKQNDKEENIVKKPEKKEMNLEEINAYMREQRHIARANKARAEAAERGNTPSNEEKTKQNNSNESNVKKPEKKEMNLEEINAYMREQRHIARANRARAEAAERGNATPTEPQTPKQSNPNESNVKKPEKKEMNLEEINAYMREQRHIARANRARAEGQMVSNQPKDTPTDTTESSSARKLTVAEARRQYKLQQQKQQQQQQQKPPSRPSSSHSTSTKSTSKAPTTPRQPSAPTLASPPSPRSKMLDKEAMKQLFKQQREELRQNRELIKACNEGAHDPKLLNKLKEKEQQLSNISRTTNKNDKTMTTSKVDFSKALNATSTGEFLKSRSLVLQELENEDTEENDNETELQNILDQAKTIHEALDIKEDETEKQKQNETKEHTPVFHLQNKDIKLPIAKDTDSISFRAEAIRAFLEKEIGISKLIRMIQAMKDNTSSADEIIKNLEPGLVVLAQQLLVLEECIESAN